VKLRGSETILVADDEATVRTYIGTVLRREGFDLLEAVDGVDALEQVERRGRPVDLLLTDVRMPRMDGIALARSVTEMYPKIPIIYISGYPFNLEEERTRRPPEACEFISKPFSRQVLLDAIHKCLSPRSDASNVRGA
jgi:CheY-like chemotaxis protein